MLMYAHTWSDILSVAGVEVVTEVASGDLVLPGEGHIEGKTFLDGGERREGGKERERGLKGERGKGCHK